MIECRLSLLTKFPQAKLSLQQFPWIQFGNIGFIAAAKQYAEGIGLEAGVVDVRDAKDLTIPIAKFELVRKVTYEVLNPRQGADGVD